MRRPIDDAVSAGGEAEGPEVLLFESDPPGPQLLAGDALQCSPVELRALAARGRLQPASSRSLHHVADGEGSARCSCAPDRLPESIPRALAELVGDGEAARLAVLSHLVPSARWHGEIRLDRSLQGLIGKHLQQRVPGAAGPQHRAAVQVSLNNDHRVSVHDALAASLPQHLAQCPRQRRLDAWQGASLVSTRRVQGGGDTPDGEVCSRKAQPHALDVLYEGAPDEGLLRVGHCEPSNLELPKAAVKGSSLGLCETPAGEG
mmetsp:Transcript_75805/g.245429  ORF Transcript_75805/g.245429 Transcript_75805/m.245429 type:complete len:261 (+) Transcript_75805:492-1274(+)